MEFDLTIKLDLVNEHLCFILEHTDIGAEVWIKGDYWGFEEQFHTIFKEK